MQINVSKRIYYVHGAAWAWIFREGYPTLTKVGAVSKKHKGICRSPEPHRSLGLNNEANKQKKKHTALKMLFDPYFILYKFMYMHIYICVLCPTWSWRWVRRSPTHTKNETSSAATLSNSPWSLNKLSGFAPFRFSYFKLEYVPCNNKNREWRILWCWSASTAGRVHQAGISMCLRIPGAVDNSHFHVYIFAKSQYLPKRTDFRLCVCGPNS